MVWVYHKAPFEFFDVDQTANVVGHWAESYVIEEYLRHVGRQHVYPVNQKDFSDFTAGFANMTLYTAFLQQNNPSLSLSQMLWMRGWCLRKIPDICTHDSPRRLEYYEVKPNSPSGRSDGLEKIAEIDAFNDNFNLPYKPGKIWKPHFYQIIFDEILQGIPTQIAFRFTTNQPGLIVYDVAYSRYPIILTEKDLEEMTTKLGSFYAKQIASSIGRRLSTVRLGEIKLNRK